LAQLIEKQLVYGENLVSKKIAVEAVGLVDPDQMKDIVGLALAYKSPWINEVALRSCHYLPEASVALKRELRFFIDRLSFVSFMKRRRELILSLTLSNVFRDLRLHCYWRVVDTLACFLAILAIVAWQPRAGSILIMCCSLLWWIDSKLEVRSRRITFNFFYLFLLPLVLAPFGLIFFLVIHREWVNDYQHVAALISATPFFLCFPWYRAAHYLPEMAWFIRSRKNLKTNVSLLLAYAIVWIVGFKVLSRSAIGVIGFVAVGISAIAIIVFLIVQAINMGRDYRRLIKLSHAPLSTRAAVAREIKKMKTGFGRVRFVRSLNERKSPTGAWPNGELPNFEDDRASTMLAQLEERWLGLDR
jgi:hypothetical protein